MDDVNDCEIEMFQDGTSIFWFKDGRVRAEFPAGLSPERRNHHFAYVRQVLDLRNELSEK